ncbi:MAG: PilN domain-containing protein [Deferribacterota bacterium]|nr:PilN domain-containing protein [Deferribacterota bacterium]
MIKIDLLEKKPLVDRLKEYIDVFVVELLIFSIVLVGVFWSMYLINRNLSYQDEIITKEMDILSTFLRPLERRYAQIKKNKKDIDDVINKVNSVLESKKLVSLYYRFMIEIEKSIPDDCWVKSFRFDNTKNNIVIEVNALRSTSVNLFVRNLSATDLFSRIQLTEVASDTEKSYEISTFKLFVQINRDSIES